ncbi:circadian clock protein KaiC [Vreelandella utahensis]|uniref:circadian clock protein KaiC n=1 Tax=Vreelandella halophila TaxID=86177 RepID=UPI000984E703|nr:circadian clock protein KaiC [Halomonas utahensis]
MTDATRVHDRAIGKVATGIPGFDHIASGGLPAGRTTLVSGSAGSAKTLMAAQFLAEGIKQFGEPGVFVTFEESAEDLRRNLASFGWDIQAWEEQGLWAFVDASPDPEISSVVLGEYDLGGLMARVGYAVQRVGATRLSMDSLGAVFNQFAQTSSTRREMFRVAAHLKKLGVTALMTSERRQEYGEIARYGVEEFVADNVVILRNLLEEEKRRRTIEILKFRGTEHHKGEYPFSIVNGEGMACIPLSALELSQGSTSKRITSGSPDLDTMCGGGFFRDSIILISGATGTGKTLMATEFLQGGISQGERCLLFAFEESRDQFTRNAQGWGMDVRAMEESDQLRVICDYPESAGIEDHLLAMKREIDEFRPDRIAVDSLSALERIATIRGFRQFVIGLTSYVKQQKVAGLFTAATPQLFGGSSVTESHISTITDSIILLRYVETEGEIRRGITVLKMRGSPHDRGVKEFRIDGSGMHIGRGFGNVVGIVSGNPQHLDVG